ncbi:MAG: hypothetical protein KC475_01700 [Cyanobacteria bacterium HKST-UBA03]|nr:hypothetical protein [Cyanobacteria bacterium HKST-UBA03]
MVSSVQFSPALAAQVAFGARKRGRAPIQTEEGQRQSQRDRGPTGAAVIAFLVDNLNGRIQRGKDTRQQTVFQIGQKPVTVAKQGTLSDEHARTIAQRVKQAGVTLKGSVLEAYA